MKVLQLIILYFSGNIVFGREHGAPPKSCFHMLPGHFQSFGFPITRQRGESPYEVKAEINGSYVRLSVNGSLNIRGFLIQARQTVNGPAIGEFKLQSQSENLIAKHQNCAEKGVIIVVQYCRCCLLLL